MNCLYLHDRRTWGPKVSSWWTFHYIWRELKRRGYLLGKYSVDYNWSDDYGKSVSDGDWTLMDCLFTVFTGCEGPLRLAKLKGATSFLEINFACGEIVTPFIQKEIDRLKLTKDELNYETTGFGKQIYKLPDYIIGAGNSYTEGTYRQFGLTRVKYFLAGIDYDFFVPLRRQKNRDKIIFTFTSATHAFRKGIYYVCQAWEKLPAHYHRKTELHFIGRSPYALGTAVAFKRLKEKFSNVFDHGFLSNQSREYLSIHGSADAMICPTLAEGQSATVLEGLSFGLFPIVSPFTGSNVNLVPSKILSNRPEDWVEELSRDIMFVVDNIDYVRRQHTVIREHTCDTYKYPMFATQVVDFIEKVFKTKHQ